MHHAILRFYSYSTHPREAEERATRWLDEHQERIEVLGFTLVEGGDYTLPYISLLISTKDPKIKSDVVKDSTWAPQGGSDATIR